MQMHREHCPDEPALVKCAHVSAGFKSSIKQDITVQSPDVMVSVWQSLAVSDLITYFICCSSAESIKHEVYRHDFSSILSIFCMQDILQFCHICDLLRFCFGWSCKAFCFLLTPANAIAHPCLFDRHAISSIMFSPPFHNWLTVIPNWNSFCLKNFQLSI